jgi:cytochrome b6-f complex iron-sulfur subunit
MAAHLTPPDESSEHAAVSRRQFLDLVWKGLLGLASTLGLIGMLRYFSYEPDPPPPTQFDLGSQNQFPPGSITILNQAEAVLIHSENKFKALSLVCPHLGCIVEVVPGGFACPCHGSRFNSDGTLVQGPANKPLRNLQVSIDLQGHLIVTRTPEE